MKKTTAIDKLFQVKNSDFVASSHEANQGDIIILDEKTKETLTSKYSIIYADAKEGFFIARQRKNSERFSIYHNENLIIIKNFEKKNEKRWSASLDKHIKSVGPKTLKRGKSLTMKDLLKEKEKEKTLTLKKGELKPSKYIEGEIKRSGSKFIKK